MALTAHPGKQYKKYQTAGNCCHIIQIALLLNNFLYTEREDVKGATVRGLKIEVALFFDAKMTAVTA